jgi:nicotinamide-nucleotide amidase
VSLDSLPAALGKALRENKHVLVTAESCTGGWVAQAVTSVAGCSDWFERGFVCYSNASKSELLGVAPGTLERHGAVSEPTARAMAEGALRRSRASVAVAVTGVAGPSGGSAEKPVGTVCFAWAKEGRTRAETRRFTGDRESVRRQSVIRALEGLLEILDSP